MAHYECEIGMLVEPASIWYPHCDLYDETYGYLEESGWLRICEEQTPAVLYAKRFVEASKHDTYVLVKDNTGNVVYSIGRTSTGSIIEGFVNNRDRLPKEAELQLS